MPEIHVEMRGVNNPIAVIQDLRSENIKRALDKIVSENRYGLPAHRAEVLLQRKLGRSIVWNNLRCSNLSDFVHKYASADFDVEYSTDSNLLIRRSCTQPGSFEL